MVSTAAEREAKKRELHNGQGGNLSVGVEDFITKAEMKGAGRLYGIMTIPPKGSIGFHVHQGEAEIYYVLSGTGKYSDNGNEMTIKAGDVTYTPSGTGHGIENIGEDDFKFIALIYNDIEEK